MAVTFPGQVTVGPSVSFTVTVNVQNPNPEAEVAVTSVVPTGKKDPDAGAEVIGPQVPDPVIAG